MKLLLDIGNSSTAWASYGASGYDSGDKFFYSDTDLARQFEQHLAAQARPEVVLFASVASDAMNTQFAEWVQQRWQIEPWQATVTKQFDGLTNSYPDIQQMGIDRWLAMVAAWSEFRGPLCVVDCGTALTIDLIKHTGQHAGGYILPGPLLMQQSLLDSTDRIKADSIETNALTPADNTQQAISHGASLAIVAAIERALADFAAPDQLQCVLTGGNAEGLMNMLCIPVHHRPHLVLDGLARMYETEQ